MKTERSKGLIVKVHIWKLKTPAARKKVSRPVTGKTKSAKKELSASYDNYKLYGGQQYTGMKIGRSHKWYYDKGEWKGNQDHS